MSDDIGIDGLDLMSDGVDRDWVLQHLVTGANAVEGFAMPISLWTNTGIISGILISGKEYFDSYTEILTEGLSPEQADSIKQNFREMASSYYEVDEDPQADETIYIHLKDARLCLPNGTVPANDGVLWRGRISQVTGFNLGRFAAISSSE